MVALSEWRGPGVSEVSLEGRDGTSLAQEVEDVDFNFFSSGDFTGVLCTDIGAGLNVALPGEAKVALLGLAGLDAAGAGGGVLLRTGVATATGAEHALPCRALAS